MRSEFSEAVREEGADGGEDEDAGGAGEDDGNGTAGEGFVFEEHLTAGAAGGDGVGQFLAVGSAGGDGDGFEAGVGISRVGIEGGGALGAGTRRIGGVFLIGAAQHLAVVEEDGGADMKFAIRGIAAVGGLTSEGHEFLLLGCEFFERGFADGYGDVKSFHIRLEFFNCGR